MGKRTIIEINHDSIPKCPVGSLIKGCIACRELGEGDPV